MFVCFSATVEMQAPIHTYTKMLTIPSYKKLVLLIDFSVMFLLCSYVHIPKQTVLVMEEKKEKIKIKKYIYNNNV